jgi:LmbE family N-acetylglucosaminyl deacetylase
MLLQIFRKWIYLFFCYFLRLGSWYKDYIRNIAGEECVLYNAKSLLILVPHYDDEVLGCYNLLRNCVKKDFDLMYVTDSSGHKGRHYDSMTRRIESDTALAGISSVRQRIYLDIPDQEVYRFKGELKDKIRLIADDYDFIFSPAYWDTTPDHSTIAHTLLETIDSDKIIYYRSTDYTFKSKSASFCSRGRIGDKLRAINAFKTQRHLALFNPIIHSSITDTKLKNIDTVECFLRASEMTEEHKQNFNTLGIYNIFNFENFTDK